MAFSNQELGKIDSIISEWCVNKVPVQLKSKIDYDYEIDGQAVSIYDVRPKWQGSPGEKSRHPVARFKYVKSSALWNIYWLRQTGKWQLYEPPEQSVALKMPWSLLRPTNSVAFLANDSAQIFRLARYPAGHKIIKRRAKFEKNHHHCRTQWRWQNNICS